MKIAIIGSGSTYTPELIEGLVNRKENFSVKEIALMDIDRRKLDIVGNLACRMVKAGKMDTTVFFTENLEEALDGATFVFAQIRVGMLPARVLDEKIPRKHGLLGQETTGIGGFFKALRTIPVMMNISAAMEKYCPDAFMINFSNPSGINAQALLNHTKTKMLGLCNAPLGMVSYPQKAFGIEGAQVDYVGLNHMSVVTGIRHGGRDYLREAVTGNEELLDKLSWGDDSRKEIIRLLEGIPNGYLNHFLFPRGAWLGGDSDKPTRGEDCIKIEEELLAMFQDENLCHKPEELSKRGGAMYSEAAVSLAESIYTDDGKVHVVNTLNNGALPYLADNDAVEVSAYVGKNGATPTKVVEPGNELVQNLIQSVKTYERYTVKAALTGCKLDAIRALMANPLIQDVTTAKAAFEELLEAHKEYLPVFF